MKKTQVLLVDDHAVVRAGFKMLLSTESNLNVCGEAERGEQAIQLYPSLQPDIVVMDLSMPGIGGLETIRRLRQRHENCNILVFSVHLERVYVDRALSAGAKGYIGKNSAPEILPEAIDAIVRGGRYVEAGLGQENDNCDFREVVDGFTAREFDVFRLLAQGSTVQEIADELCLGYKTVANYATQVKKKLNAKSIAELLRLARSLGIEQTPD